MLVGFVALCACRVGYDHPARDGGLVDGDGSPVDGDGSPIFDGDAGETTTITTDPFGDNTAFAYVTEHNGMVYFGPSQDGRAVARAMPNGSNLETLGLGLAQDSSGLDIHRNTATPYTSLGFSGCTPDTAECGPDNEDGRGLMASVDFAGAEWLVMGGGRSAGDLDYIYMVSTDTDPLALRYVDLSDATGPQTRGFSALHAYGDRLYLAMPDTGGGRPFLLALLATPPSPGLDTVKDSDVLNLKADDIPGMNTPGTQFNNPGNTSINMLVATNSHLYVSYNNASGIVVFRSGAVVPSTAADFEGQAGCSAASPPATCQGLGGNGLGDLSNTEGYSGSVLTFGDEEFVYISSGSGISGFQIHRVQ